jgi:hypothetical protein
VSTPQRKFSAKVAETLQAKAVEEPGKSVLEQVRDMGVKIWDAGKPLFDHGRDEAAAALFSANGHAHVPYGWTHANEGDEIAAPKTPEVQKEPEKEQEQDGLSL